jgi:hypothetical protein
MVTALLLASNDEPPRSFDATPVLPSDAIAGRSLDHLQAARPF